MFASLGDTIRLVAAAADKNGVEVAKPDLLWASSAPSVATTDQSGLITAIGNGAAEITTTAESGTGKAAGAAVTVRQVATALAVTPTTVAFSSLGDTLRPTVTAADGNNHPILDPAAEWASDDSTVAVVSRSGLVTATGNGEAGIAATAESGSGTVTAAVTVSVAQIPVSLALVPGSIAFSYLGETTLLTAAWVDRNGNPLADPVAWTWVSSDPAVAAVGSEGRVTANGNGAATITVTTLSATGGAITASAEVVVRQVPSDVSLSAIRRTITVGESVQVTATALDAGGSHIPSAVFSWSSSAPSIMSVDAHGLLWRYKCSCWSPAKPHLGPAECASAGLASENVPCCAP